MRLLILLICLSVGAASQTHEEGLISRIPDLTKSSVRWSSVSRNDFTPAEKNIIGLLINDSSTSFCLDFRIDGDYLDDFHMIDLDGDEDPDLIYEGFECAGLSVKTVLVYLNTGNRYKKVLQTSGRIAALKPGSGLVLYKYPCCSMTENTLISYSILPDSLSTDASVNFFYSPILKPLSKDYELMVPKSLKTGKHYNLNAETGLYYVPKDSLEKPVFVLKSLAGNIQEKTSVVSYASATDKKGTSWLYCLIPEGAAVINDKITDFPFLIWVKATDCSNDKN